MFLIDDGIPEERLAVRTMDAEILLGREVSVVQMSRDELAKRTESGSSFIRNVLSGPKIWISGDESLVNR